MKKSILIIFVFFSINFLAFGEDSIGVKKFIWASNKIKVCWLDGDEIPKQKFNNYQQSQLRNLNDKPETLTRSEKLSLQKLVNEQFNELNTGIHFIGWESCKNNFLDTQLIIITGENKDDDFANHDNESREVRLGKATLGQGYIALNEPQVTDEKILNQRMGFLFLNTRPPSSKISRFQSMSYTFLHELGHVAGLLHEHSRDEAKSDKICQLTKIKLVENNDENLYDVLSTYDNSSIMNYCYLGFVRMYGLNFKVLKKKNFWSNFSSSLLESEVSSLNDETVVRREKVNSNEQRLKINIGLSKKDKTALKCLYKSSEEVFDEQCQ